MNAATSTDTRSTADGLIFLTLVNIWEHAGVRFLETLKKAISRTRLLAQVHDHDHAPVTDGQPSTARGNTPEDGAETLSTVRKHRAFEPTGDRPSTDHCDSDVLWGSVDKYMACPCFEKSFTISHPKLSENMTTFAFFSPIPNSRISNSRVLRDSVSFLQ
jgi:hypothetical protein